MASSVMRRVFDESTDAFNRHDMDAFKANFAEGVTCSAPGGLQLRGKEEVSGFYQAWIDGFPDAQVAIREAHMIDDGFVEEGTFSGTHRGVLRTPNGDIPPTGRSVSARYVQVVRIRGEEIASFDVIYDRMELLEQLGLMGAAGAAESARHAGGTAASP